MQFLPIFTMPGKGLQAAAKGATQTAAKTASVASGSFADLLSATVPGGRGASMVKKAAANIQPANTRRAVERDLEISREDFATIKQSLKENGISNRAIRDLEDRFEEQGLTWGSFMNSLDTSVAKAKKQSAFSSLNENDTRNLTGFFQKLGFPSQEAEGLMKDIEAGRDKKVWEKVSEKIAALSADDTVSVKPGEIGALSRALDLPAEARVKLNALFSNLGAGEYDKNAIKTTLAFVKQAAADAKSDIALREDALRQDMAEVVNGALDKMENQRAASNRDTGDVARMRELIARSAREHAGHGDADQTDASSDPALKLKAEMDGDARTASERSTLAMEQTFRQARARAAAQADSDNAEAVQAQAEKIRANATRSMEAQARDALTMQARTGRQAAEQVTNGAAETGTDISQARNLAESTLRETGRSIRELTRDARNLADKAADKAADAANTAQRTVTVAEASAAADAQARRAAQAELHAKIQAGLQNDSRQAKSMLDAKAAKHDQNMQDAKFADRIDDQAREGLRDVAEPARQSGQQSRVATSGDQAVADAAQRHADQIKAKAIRAEADSHIRHFTAKADTDGNGAGQGFGDTGSGGSGFASTLAGQNGQNTLSASAQQTMNGSMAEFMDAAMHGADGSGAVHGRTDAAHGAEKLADTLVRNGLEPDHVFRQVEAGMVSNLSQGRKQITLRLDPPDLGKVHLTLSTKGKEVRAVIKAENPDVARAVGDQVNSLRASLEQQGLKVDKIEIQTPEPKQDMADNGLFQGGEQQQNQAREQQARMQRASMGNPMMDEAESLAQEMHIPLQSANIAQTGLDIIA